MSDFTAKPTIDGHIYISSRLEGFTVSKEEAEELRKQLEEALKDPLEGYGLPWVLSKSDQIEASNDVYIDMAMWRTLRHALASLSEAEQREFLMRGLT